MYAYVCLCVYPDILPISFLRMKPTRDLALGGLPWFKMEAPMCICQLWALSTHLNSSFSRTLQFLPPVSLLGAAFSHYGGPFKSALPVCYIITLPLLLRLCRKLQETDQFLWSCCCHGCPALPSRCKCTVTRRVREHLRYLKSPE